MACMYWLGVNTVADKFYRKKEAGSTNLPRNSDMIKRKKTKGGNGVMGRE